RPPRGRHRRWCRQHEDDAAENGAAEDAADEPCRGPVSHRGPSLRPEGRTGIAPARRFRTAPTYHQSHSAATFFGDETIERVPPFPRLLRGRHPAQLVAPAEDEIDVVRGGVRLGLLDAEEALAVPADRPRSVAVGGAAEATLVEGARAAEPGRRTRGDIHL